MLLQITEKVLQKAGLNCTSVLLKLNLIKQKKPQYITFNPAFCNTMLCTGFLINQFTKMRKDLEHLTKEQKEYLANKIFKKISSGSSMIWADSEQCFQRIKSALEIKK